MTILMSLLGGAHQFQLPAVAIDQPTAQMVRGRRAPTRNRIRVWSPMPKPSLVDTGMYRNLERVQSLGSYGSYPSRVISLQACGA